MAFIINIVAECSGVGKTTLAEGIIRELKVKGYSIATIKHDVHGFDIDKKGKDTYRHREAGADTVIISSKNRMAMIKEVEEEVSLNSLIKMVEHKDFIIVEGYKKSDLKKIEVFREGVSNSIITEKEKLICVATDKDIEVDGVEVININDYIKISNILIKELNKINGGKPNVHTWDNN
ncbi:MAG: molybdopterin-guanine dinucleotide biosynthesis protein B [Clostridium sp.]|uniref:molybdopterin-guanine dinucleotide biosynthesis protein B n=1 Tax=Clostridium sp. TaxID=1506 RepID=UPI003F327E86